MSTTIRISPKQSYISTSEVKKFVLNNGQTTDLSIIHVNICSLPGNIDKLINLIAELDIKPDIIAISETKITISTNQDFKPNIENYSFFNIPSLTSAGGVGIFLLNTLKFSIRNELCSSEKGQYETLWFDVFCNKKTATKLTFE